MKRVLLIVIVLAIFSLTGCGDSVDKVVTVKNSLLLKSLPSATEVLLVEVDGGSLFVWTPDDKLKEFFAKTNPGDRILLKARERKGESSTMFDFQKPEGLKFHVIFEVIKLSNGSRYKQGA